ncbi:MAG: polyprenyl synthetase family protein, partial [Acetobacterium sp.]|nr:polyprenyl synthetase family protein [Acetobacterium sp.]
MSNFKTQLNDRVAEINGELEKVFQQNLDTPEVIIEAMKYSLFAGGKRLRPILMMETCRALEGDLEIIKPLAMGIE